MAKLLSRLFFSAIALMLISGCGRLWIDVHRFASSVTIPGYNGVMLVQAFGDAPNAPPGTPVNKVVNITWLEFSLASLPYALLRVPKNGAFDKSRPPNCTPGSTGECLVCTASVGGLAHSCSDLTIAVTPAQYDYMVTMQNQDGTVSIPSNPAAYRIAVQIPPNNMVLVQRDAANYEMCKTLGRLPDPLNHQRCLYAGLGAVPYNTSPGNTPLNLAAGYYDFGYNLFVDRWAMGCKWTTVGNGGMCGTGPAAGNCFGQGSPTNGSQGVSGNVYYDTLAGDCYVNATGVWQSLNSGSLSAAQVSSATSIDPGSGSGKNPPVVQISQIRSWNACQSIQDTNYGYKRLMRHREYIVAAAWPSFPGEASALTDAQIDTLEGGNGHGFGTYSCNADSGSGIVLGAFTTTNLSGDIAGGSILSFITGSVETSKCVSRFGAQDLVGNVFEWMSDQLSSCSTVAHACNGITSTLDSGNIDMNGFNFDGTKGPGGVTAGQVGPNFTFEWSLQSGVVAGTTSTQGYGAGYFSWPLGLPMVGNDNGNATLISSVTNKFHNDLFGVYTDFGNVTRGLIVSTVWLGGASSGRWLSNWQNDTVSTAYNNVGLRCALPAE